MLFPLPDTGPPDFLQRLWPVGSIFLSAVATDPAALLGFGTWTAIGAGRVLVGQDAAQTEFDTLGETGGSKTSTPSGTVSQPTFAGDPLATHSHATGTLAASAHTGTAVADHASHTHTYTDVPNHTHVLNAQGGTTAATTGTHIMTSTAVGGSARAVTAGDAVANNTGGVATGTTNGPSAVLTHSVTQPANHTLSGSTAAVTAGTPSGTVSQPTFTGATQSILPPYLVVKMWQRVA